jgi:hypothetical protein
MTDTIPKTTIMSERSAVAWSYLDAMILAYKVLLDAQTEYARVYQDRMHAETKKKYRRNYAATLQSFYMSTAALFKAYLSSPLFQTDFPNSQIKWQDYSILYTDTIDSPKLFEMAEIICVWSQTKGPFRTINQSVDPHNAIMGSGVYR